MTNFQVRPYEHRHLSNTVIDYVEFEGEPTYSQILDALEHEDHGLIDGEEYVRSDLMVIHDGHNYIVQTKEPNAYGESYVWLLERVE